MSKDKVNNDESQNKGGRYPEYNAKYFTVNGIRTDELEILKMEFGSEGVDFYISVFETLCLSDYFIYPFQNKYKLELLAKRKDIAKERFLEILKFSVDELNLFNKPLYEKGYIFSEAFLNTFDNAGLFRSRTMTAEDCRNKVKEYLGEVKPQLTDSKDKPGSVEAPIVKNSTVDNRTEEEKKETNRSLEVESMHKETKVSHTNRGKRGGSDFSDSVEPDLIF